MNMMILMMMMMAMMMVMMMIMVMVSLMLMVVMMMMVNMMIVVMMMTDTKCSVAGHARLCIAWIRCGSFDGCTLVPCLFMAFLCVCELGIIRCFEPKAVSVLTRVLASFIVLVMLC